MAACLISHNYRPIPKPWSNWSNTNALQCITSCFTEARSQLIEDGGSQLACTLRKVLTTPDNYWQDWTENSSWIYLCGEHPNEDVKINKKINNKLAKVNSVFDRLYKCMWNNKHLKKGTKISIYNSCCSLMWLRVMVHLLSPLTTL